MNIFNLIRFNCLEAGLVAVRPLYSLPMVDSHASASNHTTDPSATNFTAIFEAASNKYKTLTGQDLRTHPLATEFEGNSNSLDSILGVFRKQATALDKFRNDDDRLMKSLTPIVNILFTFSATLGSLVSLHCFSIPLLQCLFPSHSHLQRRCLLALVYFSG